MRRRKVRMARSKRETRARARRSTSPNKRRPTKPKRLKRLKHQPRLSSHLLLNEQNIRSRRSVDKEKTPI
jgi:hypothetical protein